MKNRQKPWTKIHKFELFLPETFILLLLSRYQTAKQTQQKIGENVQHSLNGTYAENNTTICHIERNRPQTDQKNRI